MTILLLAVGIAILVLGGEFLVRGAVSVAAGLGMSPLVIGIVVVGFGTSMPELVTSVEAALVGSPGVAVGNVVGSNICNILLILGLTALIKPVLTAKATLKRDGAVLAVATILCVITAMTGMVERATGLIFAMLLGAYVLYACIGDRRQVAADAAEAEIDIDIEAAQATGLGRAALMIAAGLAMMIFGAQMLVDAAVTLAERLGVSDAIIGLTLVALGTSLPELVTSVVAAARGHNDVGFGNIVGSNIYNILGILGITAIIKPVEVPAEIMQVDIWVMTAATALLLGAAFTGWRVCRAEGGAMLAGYVAYIGWLSATALGSAAAAG
ncbi:MAG: calcium/sodium antiporter [Rubrimonas sp.]|uniref:calcium/sodium antiporter n=1 Tax=Rubrimonas sp. TaxID=2036015 RepID=UPI002FDDF4C3